MIILTGSTMGGYPQGGGHWSVRLQYMMGLRGLGIDFRWVEIFRSRGSPRRDNYLIRTFLNRFKRYGLDEHCIILWHPASSPFPTMDQLKVINESKKNLFDLIKKTDLLWNFHCSMRTPLLSMFSKKALLDLDPGHLQASSLIHTDMNIEAHDVFFTVGTNYHGGNCEAPTLGKQWNSFFPPIHLPLWKTLPSAGPKAPFTSVTQWTWGCEEEISYEGRILNVGKRDAYIRYIELPRYCKAPLELAANIHSDDSTGDREMLNSCGWRLKSPHNLARTPYEYGKYILRSKGEFGCCKPIHSELKTGWFSDRSAAFLASGRPVVIEETELKGLPKDIGILTFTNFDHAVEQLNECSSNYEKHSRAAREIAETYLDARLVLPKMIEQCWVEYNHHYKSPILKPAEYQMV